ncbi:RNA polymerase sigma factor [Streptosporangium sp. V21-05]|uniref:RNA polymerase sigma factor n=1 Tax=Streptosporangium sp. V21-05 TaxID=3446115 RepID=UPI003F530AF9
MRSGRVPDEREQRGPPDPRQRFEKIYTAHYPDILAYLRRRTVSSDDAADALAETFTAAWRRLADIPDGHAARLRLYGARKRLARELDTAGFDLTRYGSRAIALTKLTEGKTC